MVGAQGVLLALGHLVELGHPVGFGGVAVGLGHAVVDGLAPHARHVGHIGGAALAAFDLDGAHADLGELGQQLQRVQAGGFFDGVVVLFVAHVKAALAQRGVARVFAGGVAVNQHAVQARFETLRGFLPAHGFGRRAHAVGVGRFARHVRRQGAAALHHHAQAAKAEDFDLDRRALDHLAHLLHRQHARQHGAHHAKLLAVEVDGLVIGGRALHRQVQPQLRVVLRGVLHEAGVGQDDGVQPHVHGLVHRAAPGAGVGGLRVGVERHEHLAPALVGVGNAAGNGGFVKVQPGKVAGVGGIAQAQVHAVGTVVDGGLQGGQAAGGADQFRGRGCGGGVCSRGQGFHGKRFIASTGMVPRHWPPP